MLHLTLKENDGPLYMQIYQQIKQQIRAGVLPDNYRLPSKRQLAAQMQISVNTVSAAYSQLVSEGFLSAQPQRGFFVCHLDELIQGNSPTLFSWIFQLMTSPAINFLFRSGAKQ